MRKISPPNRRKNFCQIHFDLDRVLLAREAEAARESFTVRIDGDAGLVKGVAEYHVSRFPADAGKSG